MTRILFSFILITSSYLSIAQNKAVFFNDSIIPAYKLMSVSVDGKNSSKTFELTLRNGKATTYNLADIHSLRYYASTKEAAKLTISFFANQQESAPITYKIAANQSGYIIENFPIPTSTNSGSAFNYKAVTAIKIIVNGDEETLIDEFSFHYSEDAALISGPESITPMLEDKEEDFRNEKAKENNSEFFKRKKEFENR